MDYTEKPIRAEDKFKGRIVYLHVDDVLLPDGRPARREVVEHSGGVAVIPVDEAGNVYCVRQYRYAVGCHVLETPAGKLEPGEEPLACAVRELSEETGFRAGTMTYLGAFYPSPGYCKELLHVYLATDLHPGSAHLDDGEFLEVEKHPLAELVAMAMDNEIVDAKTIIAILKAKLYFDRKGA